MSGDRFVFQEHVTEPHHVDMMFELAGALQTWSMPDVARVMAGVDWPPLPCRKIFDHRLKYLDYEGEIPGKGSVCILARGVYTALARGDAECRFRLRAPGWNGLLAFAHVVGTDWTVSWRREQE